MAPALAFRIHDLRVTAVTRMLNAGVPIAKVAKIVGWSQSTMIAMSKKYGQFSTEDLRSAVESISRGSEDLFRRYPPKVPTIAGMVTGTRYSSY